MAGMFSFADWTTRRCCCRRRRCRYTAVDDSLWDNTERATHTDAKFCNTFDSTGCKCVGFARWYAEISLDRCRLWNGKSTHSMPDGFNCDDKRWTMSNVRHNCCVRSISICTFSMCLHFIVYSPYNILYIVLKCRYLHTFSIIIIIINFVMQRSCQFGEKNIQI